LLIGPVGVGGGERVAVHTAVVREVVVDVGSEPSVRLS
jgi:hypothetical protein